MSQRRILTDTDLPITAYRLLHGECDSVAALISDMLAKAGIEHYIERMEYSEDCNWAYIHEYVVAKDADDNECYMDIRGVEYDKAQFLQHFLDYESARDPDFEAEKVVFEVCEDKEYTDWMYTVDWIKPSIKELFHETMKSNPQIQDFVNKTQNSREEMER